MCTVNFTEKKKKKMLEVEYCMGCSLVTTDVTDSFQMQNKSVVLRKVSKLRCKKA